MLSIWLASEEMDDELLRLDPAIVERDSNFIAQEREINHLVSGYREQFTETVEHEKADAAHAWVMLQQCADQIKNFRQLALNEGSDLNLTYLLERLEQILNRIRILLGIVEEEDKEAIQRKCLGLFRQLVMEQSKERSVTSLIRQTSYLLAKSITNHASKTGEHYVTQDRREYLGMIGKRGRCRGLYCRYGADQDSH